MRNTLFILIFLYSSHTSEAAKPKSTLGKDMQYGPCLCHSVTFTDKFETNAPTWDGALTRTLNISLPGKVTACYDADRLTLAAYWQGNLDLEKTHHRSFKGGRPPRPGGKVEYLNLKDAGWLIDGKEPGVHFHGYYLHGNEVVLSYQVGNRNIFESLTAASEQIGRVLHIAPGNDSLTMLIRAKDQKQAFTLNGNTDGIKVDTKDGRVYAHIPASKSERVFTVWFGAKSTSLPTPIDPTTKIKGGPRRWKERPTASIEKGDDKSAYTLDTFDLPENPWNAWLRFTGIDCFDDGRVVLTTLSGDVWIVTWQAGKPSLAQWQRFATGLYEPLGVKVVKGKIYVRGRDRITRLHDLNADGEADYYENFHSGGKIGPGYHAFLFDLVTDKAGNFYFSRSGRKAPSKGEVVRIDSKGNHREILCEHFRHPNGMGAGGPQDWVLVADNPKGSYPSGAMIVQKGRSYGHNGPRTAPYLYLLPPSVDSSSGSMCWSDTKRWGPLGGSIVHTSFSKSTCTYVVTQTDTELPNGFAVQLPFRFRSGVMRVASNPRDGQIYVIGQRGWDTNAAADGCLQRIRYTGQQAYVLTGAKAVKKGVQLSFSVPLDPKTVDFENFYAEREGPKRKTEVDIEEVHVVDERTVLVEIEGLDELSIIDERATKKDESGQTHYQLLEPLGITFQLKAKDGKPIEQTVWCTINSMPKKK